MANHPFLDLYRLRRAGQRALLATVVHGVGPTYRRPGSSAVIADGGQVLGAISGGCLESDLLAAATEVLDGGAPRLLEYDSSSEDDLIWGTATGCGGRVQVLLAPVPDDLLAQMAEAIGAGDAVVLETVIAPGDDLGARRLGLVPAPAAPAAGQLSPTPSSGGEPFWYSEDGARFHQIVTPPPTLLLCGAGNDAQPVAALASQAGFRVVVADHRPAWATAARFPTADDVVVCTPDELAQRIHIRPETVSVIMTHHFERDRELLTVLLNQPDIDYVGLLGSHTRSRELIAEVLAAAPHLATSVKSKLSAPVGLDLGADGPDQIAVSIVAQLLAHMNGRPKFEIRKDHATLSLNSL